MPFIEEVRGASPEREKTQEGMTSSTTRTNDGKNRDDNNDKDTIKLHVFNVVLDRAKMVKKKGEQEDTKIRLVFLQTKFCQVISCPVATRRQVCQVLVVLRQHDERLFPTQRRLEKAGERENPGGDDPVRVSIYLYFIYFCNYVNCTIARLLYMYYYYKLRYVNE